MVPDRHQIVLYYKSVNKMLTIETTADYLERIGGYIVDIYLHFFSTDHSPLAPALHLT